MVKDRKDMRPLLVQLGMAIAVSLAGFLYSHLANQRARISRPPQPRNSSSSKNEVGRERRARRRDEHREVNIAASDSSFSSSSVERNEDEYLLKDNSTVSFSSRSKEISNEDRFLLPEFHDIAQEFDIDVDPAALSPKKGIDSCRLDVETPRACAFVEEEDYEHEIRLLKNTVEMLQERERSLEIQLLELYGLKEQESSVMELQNRLKIKTMEAKFLNVKVESLRADNKKLQEQVEDHEKIVNELDAARGKIEQLKKRLRTETEQNKEQILTLQRRVSKLREQELQELKAAIDDSEILLKLQRLEELEVEVEDLRKSNSMLQLENSELSHRLESTQLLANSVMEESEAQKLRELSSRLIQEKENLEEQIEQLQTDRSIDVEELVYLRWINACLRYELRNFQPPLGKTAARDLSRSLSPESEKKAKQLILEYASSEEMAEKGINLTDFESETWSSSQGLYFTDSRDIDESSQSSKAHSSGKMKIFKKLRRLLRGKDAHEDHQGSSDDKSGELEDYDSPQVVSTISTAISDAQFSRAQTPLQGSSRNLPGHQFRHSLDLQKLKITKMDSIKGEETLRRNSDVGLSSRPRKLSSTRSNNLSVDDHDFNSGKKSELLKFAEALKDSSGIARHRKTVSFDTFETARRADSEWS